MAEALPVGRWRYRLLFAGIVCFLFFVQLLPLDVGPGGLPGPDVLLLLVVDLSLELGDAAAQAVHVQADGGPGIDHVI